MDYSAEGKTNGSLLARNQWSGILFGLGLAAFVDEAVFHQLLHWHHFYDKSTTAVGLVSDGLFHAISWFATVASLFMLADLKRHGAFIFARWQGFALIGSGGFQLYDGIIQHKIMRIHQIRYVDNVLVYDIVWNVIAVVMIIAGIIVVSKSKKKRKGPQSNDLSSSFSE